MVAYHRDALLPHRFYTHYLLGTTKGLPHRDHTPGKIEKAGNFFLAPREEFLTALGRAIKNPKVITLALTFFSSFLNSLMFYRKETLQAMSALRKFVPFPTLGSAKLITYLFISSTILGYGLRAYGRFSDTELMRRFYAQREPADRWGHPEPREVFFVPPPHEGEE